MSLEYKSNEVCSFCHETFSWSIEMARLKEVAEKSHFISFPCPHCNHEFAVNINVSTIIRRLADELERNQKILSELKTLASLIVQPESEYPHYVFLF